MTGYRKYRWDGGRGPDDKKSAASKRELKSGTRNYQKPLHVYEQREKQGLAKSVTGWLGSWGERGDNCSLEACRRADSVTEAWSHETLDWGLVGKQQGRADMHILPKEPTVSAHRSGRGESVQR